MQLGAKCLDVVAGIDDHVEPVAEDVLHPGRELRPARAARQDDRAGRGGAQLLPQVSASPSPVSRIPAWVL